MSSLGGCLREVATYKVLEVAAYKVLAKKFCSSETLIGQLDRIMGKKIKLLKNALFFGTDKIQCMCELFFSFKFFNV